MGNSCGIMVNCRWIHGQLLRHHGQLQVNSWATLAASWLISGETHGQLLRYHGQLQVNSWATLAASRSTTGELMGNSCGIMVNFRWNPWATLAVSWSTAGELMGNSFDIIINYRWTPKGLRNRDMYLHDLSIKFFLSVLGIQKFLAFSDPDPMYFTDPGPGPTFST